MVRRDERVEDPGQAQVRVVGEEGLHYFGWLHKYSAW